MGAPLYKFNKERLFLRLGFALKDGLVISILNIYK